MSKRKKRSFTELVNENKLQILRDKTAIEKIEERLEKKQLSNHSSSVSSSFEKDNHSHSFRIDSAF